MATLMHNPPVRTDLGVGDVEELNALLRGEMSAVETYTQALTKFDDQDTVSVLSDLCDEHTQAVSLLRGRVLAAGGTPAASSGLWGSFAATVTGAAKLIGPQTVLVALREGEEIGCSNYDKALEREDLSEQCKTVIHDDLVRRIHKHILALNRLIDDYAAD